MIKRDYEPPEAEAILMDPALDVCNDPSLPSGNTDPLNPTPGGGWEDEFGN